MKKNLIKTFILGSFFVANVSSAFCVYNFSSGNDTTRYDGYFKYQAPTSISYETTNNEGKIVAQGDYGCTMTNRRGPTEVSTVNVYWHKETFYRGRRGTQMLCSRNVYNKGGYLILSGNAQSGFICNVYREPQH